MIMLHIMELECTLIFHLLLSFLSVNFMGIVTSTEIDESDFVDEDIPKDWRTYFPDDSETSELLKIVGDQSTDIFQGDITSIHPDSALHNRSEFANKIVAIWPDRIVFYEFEAIDPDVEAFTRLAIKDLESKTCVRFLPRRNRQKDYLLITGGSSCASNIGKSGGKQVLYMNRGCQDGLGATQHEFMHALGIIHEQARPDRDEFVWINLKNIKKEAVAQFVKQPVPELTKLNITYDYESVMHYPWNAYANNPFYPTIIPKEKGVYFGKRNKLSKLDIERINQLYRCDRVRPQESVTLDYSATWTNWFKLCDGIKDTPEGWDEIPDICLKMCNQLDTDSNGNSLGLFNLPSSKRCMQKTYFCDGIKDSEADVSENTAICQQYCQGGGYVAIAPSYQCIHFQYLCDGQNDTLDGSDEKRANCDFYCKTLAELPTYEDVYFQLEPLGRCMQKTWLCDGFQSNPFDTTEITSVSLQYCKRGGYLNTNTTKQCIHWSSLCDGQKDATDVWDEDPENCLSVCPIIPGLIGHLINAPTALPRCLRKTFLCDGIKDNNEDVSENTAVCDAVCKDNGYFPTPDLHQCIRVTSLCDGVVDTRNGWDELSKNCLQYCKIGPHNSIGVRREKGTKRCLEV